MTTHVHHPRPGYTGSATINGRTLHFEYGHAQADGMNLAAFRRAGYTLTGEEITDLQELTVDQLREYAAEHDIELQGAKRKTDIVDAIASAPAEPINDPNAEQS